MTDCTHIRVTAFGLDQEQREALFDRVVEAAHRRSDEELFVISSNRICDCKENADDQTEGV